MPQQPSQPQPTGVRNPSTVRAEVQEFLTALARAMIGGDGDAVARMWEAPALVIGNDGVLELETPRRIAQELGGGRQLDEGNAFASAHPDLIDLERIGERLVIATVRWPLVDSSGREACVEIMDYLLRRDDRGALKVRCVVKRGVEPPASRWVPSGPAPS